FGDARQRCLEPEVLLPRLGDQPVEHRVLEHRPPLAEVDLGAREVRRLVVDPLLGGLRAGLLVVGTDFEAVAEPAAETACTESCQQTERQPGKSALQSPGPWGPRGFHHRGGNDYADARRATIGKLGRTVN